MDGNTRFIMRQKDDYRLYLLFLLLRSNEELIDIQIENIEKTKSTLKIE